MNALADIGILLAVIVLLILSLQLRAMLGMIFRTVTDVRIVPEMTPPAGMEDLIARGHEELLALGFSGPTWLVRSYEPAEGAQPGEGAAYRHEEKKVVLWLSRANFPQDPNRLASAYTTELADGRVLTSVIYDSSEVAFSVPRFPVQVIAEPERSAQFQQHLAWCSGFGTPPAASAMDDAGLLKLSADLNNAKIDALLEKGRLYRDRESLVRASAGTAFRLVGKYWTRPKRPVDAQAVPLARTMDFAQMMERARALSPPLKVQAWFFVLSIVLSAILGAAFWNVAFAMILLGVIIFHELGHFLAMRAFGYRNVHMTVLPLVGGVTIGHDVSATPSQRAWMALMGPLPGIVLGWVVLAAHFATGGEHAWVMMLATTLLLINYLNVLPIPPLDGSHVMQALFPAKAGRVRAAIFAVGCVLGCIGAIYAQFYALAALAAYSLTGVRGMLHSSRVIRDLEKDPEIAAAPDRSARLYKILEAFQRAGTLHKKVLVNVVQAENVLRVLETRPMRLGPKLVVGSVYAFLLAGPLALAAISYALMHSVDADQPLSQHAQAAQRSAADIRAGVEAMEYAAVIRELAAPKPDQPPAPPPATADEIAAAEASLHVRLPEDLRAVYAVADGLPDVELVKLAGLQPADAATIKTIRENANGEDLYVGSANMAENSGAAEPPRLAPQRFGGMLALKQPGEYGEALLLDVASPPALPGLSLYAINEGYATGYRNFEQFLRETAINNRVLDANEKIRASLRLAALKQLAGMSLKDMLGQLPAPGFLQRRVLHQQACKRGASPQQIAETEARLGWTLPDDLREFYATHDGCPYPLPMSPLKELVRYTEMPAPRKSPAEDAQDAPPEGFDDASLKDCIVLHAYGRKDSKTPSAAWCPPMNGQAARIADISEREFQPSFTEYVRQKLAGWKAFND